MTNDKTLKVWLDFLCPWARIGALWIRNVEATGELDLELEFKTFSLEQINLPEEMPVDELWATATERRGLIPAAAAKYVQTQAPESFAQFQVAMFDARHVEKEKIGQPGVTAKILSDVGLDGAAIVQEITENPKWLDAARADHEEAAEQKIFGVPTFVFPGTAPAFIRLMEVTEGDRAVQIYSDVKAAAGNPTIHEIKRPSFY